MSSKLCITQQHRRGKASAKLEQDTHLLSARHLPVPPHMSQGTTPVPMHSRHGGTSDGSGPTASGAADASGAPAVPAAMESTPATPNKTACVQA